jgi:hypothetical protein
MLGCPWKERLLRLQPSPPRRLPLRRSRTIIPARGRSLRTDPTPTGVKSITPRIEGALGVEKELMEKIDAVISRIDSMRGSK